VGAKPGQMGTPVRVQQPAISNSGDCYLKSNSNIHCLPQLISAAEVAGLTGWSTKHIYDLAQKGLIPHYRIGGSIKFDPIKVKAWLDQHEIAA